MTLYRPIPFGIVRWDSRPAIFPDPGHGYNLRANELGKFLAFSRRLMSLHVSRNLFDRARYLPDDLDDDVRGLLGGSRADEKRVLETEAYLMIATSLFEDACRQWHGL